MTGRYTAAELDLLTRLVTAESVTRAAEDSLWDQHEAAREHAAKTGQPVQGVCPTMFRNPHERTKHPIDCQTLSVKLVDHADELRQKGPYR